MIYAAVLAGGTGNRMGNVDKPKQFLHIGKKPIIIHTVEKLIINERFDKVIVLCPEQWMTYTKDILSKYLPGNDAVVVTPGGDTRNGTILNAVNYIEENYGLAVNKKDYTVVYTPYAENQPPDIKVIYKRKDRL